MATYTDVSLDLSTLPVQPSPTNNVESLLRVDVKESAFSSTTFNKTLHSQIQSDEILELVAMHIICQDGLIDSFIMYADYNAIVNNPGNSGQGVDGYIDGITPSNLTTVVIDGELPNLGGGLAAYSYMETNLLHSGLADQRHIFVKAKDMSNLWRAHSGATVKLRFNLSNFTPSNEEFVDMAFWFRKITHNSGQHTTV